MSIEEKTRRFIEERFGLSGAMNISADEDLMESSVFDSLGIFELVSFLEKSFGIKVPEDEMTVGNLSTISSIVRYVSSKVGGAGSPNPGV